MYAKTPDTDTPQMAARAKVSKSGHYGCEKVNDMRCDCVILSASSHPMRKVKCVITPGDSMPVNECVCVCVCARLT